MIDKMQCSRPNKQKTDAVATLHVNLILMRFSSLLREHNAELVQARLMRPVSAIKQPDVRIVCTSDPAIWSNLLCKLDYLNDVCRTLSAVVS